MLRKMTDLTAPSFADFVSTKKFTVIHFWAIWNGYDVTMKDILERQIPAELRDLIALARLDVDRGENPRICRQIKLRNVPSLALYRDGELFEIVTGLREPHEITEHLRKLVCQIPN